MSDENQVLSQISQQENGCYTDEIPCNQLKFLSVLQMQRKKLQLELDTKRQRLDAEFNNEIAALTAEIVEETIALEDWAVANRQHIPPQDGKTIKFTTGTISWRNGKESLVINDEKQAVKILINLKLGQYLNQKITLGKAKLANANPDLLQKLGIYKQRGPETLTFTPTNGDKIELKEQANGENPRPMP